MESDLTQRSERIETHGGNTLPREALPGALRGAPVGQHATPSPPLRRLGVFSTQRRWTRYRSRTFYLFAAPWIAGFLALTVFPMVYALVISFTNWDGYSPKWKWVGLANYSELLHDPTTWFSLSRTLIFTGLFVPGSVLGGLGLAVLLNRPLPAIGVFRAIFYLPAVVPVVASTIAWKLIFNRDIGALNALLGVFHVAPVNWLVDPTAFWALVILSFWGVGGGMIISLAGLQGIPTELKEAALVDGANAWQSFRNVTLPLLTPVLFFQVITGVIFALQALVQPLLLTAASGSALGTNAGVGGVPKSNLFYMVNAYEQFFVNGSFGYGSALLWALFVVILVATLLVLRSSSLWVYYEVDQDAR